MAELAFIGLASNVLQFLEIGIRLAANARELYRSSGGTTAMNAQFERDTKELKSLMEQLQSSSSPSGSTEAQRHLFKSVESSIEASNTLLVVLDELKIKDGMKGKLMEVFKRTIFNESKRGKVIQLYNRLKELEDATMFHIVVALREDQSLTSKAIRSLGNDNHRLQAETTRKLDSILKNLKALSDSIPTDPVNKTPEDPKEMDSLMQRIRDAWPKDLQFNFFYEEWINDEKQRKFLGSLQFPEIRARHQSIKEAHPETFNWILEDQSSVFRHWLEEGDGIYWIAGKAGSGKSTLMRFLIETQQTRNSLAAWAGRRKWLMASHFFWYAGSPLQKSREGLLRTLLFQILKQIPDRIKSLFPSRWDSVNHDFESWSEEELLQALKQLSLEPGLPFRLCFFIDGLDEFTAGAKQYYGDFEELVDVFEALSSSSVVKVCVSSRPWTAFDRAFKENPNQLRLEDLTKDDIQNYVLSKFRTSQQFQALATVDTRYKALSKSIVRKAQGVFLWVYLVVDSLIRGASAEDNFYDLQARLNEIPTGLDDYFEHMLKTIEPVYLRDTLCIFRFAVDANQPLPLLAYHFLDRLLSHHSVSLSREPCSDEYRSEKEKTKTRLHARCKDLLEVVHYPDKPSFMSSRIDFLHRTVRDFLLGNRFLENMMSERKIKFDSLMSISKVILALIKTLDAIYAHARMMSLLSGSLMHYVQRVEQEIIDSGRQEKERIDRAHALLDELDNFISRDERWSNISMDSPIVRNRKRTILASAIEGNLFLYVTRKLDAQPQLIKNERGWPLLDYALRPSPMTLWHYTDFDQGPHLPLVKLLLLRGADPNERILAEYDSLWGLFLKTRKVEHLADSTQLVDLHKVMMLMISYGADCHNYYFKSIIGFDDCSDRMGLSDIQIQDLRDAANLRIAEHPWVISLLTQLSRMKALVGIR